MDANLTELTDIAIVALVAVALGLMLVRLRQPPIVGYILAGVVLGPTGLGLVGNSESITLLAELGVLVLLFLIGMELSLRAFVLVLRPAVLTAALQIVAALALTFLFGAFADWSPATSILLGFALAVSSTALAVKMLEDIDELRSDVGRITVGVLIAQDIAIVPILILSRALGGGGTLDPLVLIKLALAIAALALLIVLLSRPGRITLPFGERIAGRPDLLTLTMLAICLAGAAVSGLFGLSPVYGAFIAGLIVGKSNLRGDAITATRPVQSLLIVVFFLSIGLLINLDFLAENWAALLLFVLGIVVVKSALNVLILRLVGQPWETAYPAGLIMAQVGEFSFVVAAVGLSSGVIDFTAYQVMITVIAVSLLISPFWLVSVRRFHQVADHGINSFREALAEVYEDELAEIERGAARLHVAGRAALRWGKAARRTTARAFNGNKNGNKGQGAARPPRALPGAEAGEEASPALEAASQEPKPGE